jgi:translocation and assembly module TamB
MNSISRLTTGLAFGNAALSEAIGQEIRLTMQGSGSLTGPAQVKSLRITAPALSAEFKGDAGTGKATGHIEIEMPNLARFGTLAGLALQGRAKLGADIEAVPSVRRFTATIDATARQIAIGVPQIDGLAGGEVRLTGNASSDPDTGIHFHNLSLRGTQASARLNGTANSKAADISALLMIPSLERADKRLSGRGEVKAHVNGTLDHPDVTLLAEIRDGSLLGRAVPRLTLEARGTNLLGAFNAEAKLDGNAGGKTAQGSAHFVRLSNNEIQLDPLDGKVGSVTATGAVTVNPDRRASGKLTVRGSDSFPFAP